MKTYFAGSLLLCILSFLVNAFGGLYIDDYVSEGDLYKISELQGIGSKDDVCVILASIILLLASMVSLSINFAWRKTSIILMVLAFAFSLFVLSLMDTSDFSSIAFATIFKGSNVVFSLWFLVYLGLFAKIVYDFYVEIIRAD